MPDVAAYLARLGLATAPTTDAAGIAALQLAHRRGIPFENLAIPLGAGIAIDSASAFAKLVAGGRGGYCFEQNRLYADMLLALGLPTRPLLARVLLGPAAAEPPPRSHVLLLAELGGTPWILDAGFGGSYVPPLPLAEGPELQTPDGARHRLVRSGSRGSFAGEWRLERAGPPAATDGRALDHGGWQPQYCFDLAEVAPNDLAQANHWTASHPSSRFVQLCVVSIVTEGGFASLVGTELALSGPQAEKRALDDPAAYREELGAIFRLTLSAADTARLPLFA